MGGREKGREGRLECKRRDSFFLLSFPILLRSRVACKSTQSVSVGSALEQTIHGSGSSTVLKANALRMGLWAECLTQSARTEGGLAISVEEALNSPSCWCHV